MKRAAVALLLAFSGLAGAVASPACGGKTSSTSAIPDAGPLGDVAGNPVGDAAVPVVDASVPGLSRNGWTWSNVGPQGSDFLGVWGSGPDDVLFVGGAGTILHWNGHAFSMADSGSAADLDGRLGERRGRRVGRGQAELRPRELRDLALERRGLVARAERPLVGALRRVGERPERRLGGGRAGHHRPLGRERVDRLDERLDERFLDGVWASGPGDAWAVGSVSSYGSTILRWNGSAWSKMTSPDGGEGDYAHVWGTGPDDVWLVGGAQLDTTQPGDDPSGYVSHWNGSSWSPPYVVTPYDTPLFGVSGSGPGQAQAVGSAGAVQSWNGSAWSPGDALPGDYRSIWASGPKDAWAVGLGGVMAHWDGAVWTILAQPPPAFGYFSATSVWANSPIDALGRWQRRREPGLRALGRPRVDELQHPSTSPSYAYVYALWGTGPDDVWGAGANSMEQNRTGRIVHWDGTAWSDAYDNAGTSDFRGIWASGPKDVWASGYSGTLAHYDGKGWSVVPMNTQDTFFAVGGSGPHDVWVTQEYGGDSVTLRHWDGSAWSVAYTGTGLALSLWATGPKDAWAVGWSGLVLHWDGSTWSDASGATKEDLTSVWGCRPGDVWAVGSAAPSSTGTGARGRRWP